MKTELEKKLNKLPDEVMYENTSFGLKITKINVGKGNNWFINYIDKADNSLIFVEHKSLQAAVDTTLREIKQYVNEEYKTLEFLKKHTGYKLNK